MARRFETIVVGGGILGVSVACWLATLGAKKVALFEARHLAYGATGRSAGIVTCQLWNPLDVQLVKLSCEEFERGTGSEPALKRIGLVTVAVGAKSESRLERLRTRVANAGIAARLITAREIRDLIPGSHVNEAVMGCHETFSGYVNPAEFVNARGWRAHRLGVQMFGLEPAQRILVDGGKVIGLATTRDTYEAEVVVVASGAWGRRLLLTAGVDVPCKPYRTQAVVLKAPWSLQTPMLHDTPLDFYLRPEGEDLVLFGDGTELRETNPDLVSDSATWEFQAEVAEKFTARFPGLKDAQISSGWSGVCTATPDRLPLIGEIQAAGGLYCALGMQGLGVMRGPAIARVLAHLVLGKKPPLDLSRYDVNRFRGYVDFQVRPGFTLGWPVPSIAPS